MKTFIPRSSIVGFWLRFLSDFIDGTLLAFTGWLLSIPLRDTFQTLGQTGVWVGLGITFLYNGLLHSKIGRGQSVAKRLLNIQVIKRDGRYLTLWESCARSLVIVYLFYYGWIAESLTMIIPQTGHMVVLIVLSTIWLVVLVGCTVLVALHPLKRGLHDRVAGSMVVRKGEYDAEEIAQRLSPFRSRLAWGVSVFISIGMIAGFQLFTVQAQDLFNQMRDDELDMLADQIESEWIMHYVYLYHVEPPPHIPDALPMLVVKTFMKDSDFNDIEHKKKYIKALLKDINDYSKIERIQTVHLHLLTGFNIAIYRHFISEFRVYFRNTPSPETDSSASDPQWSIHRQVRKQHEYGSGVHRWTIRQ
jgi:uncharacterized RDD family membrane protein YckC